MILNHFPTLLKKEFYEYHLTPQGSLGGLSPEKKKKRQGFLFKLTFFPDQIGYSDFFPWPERGDLCLSDAFTSLHTENPSLLLLQSITNAYEDSCARKEKKSILKEINFFPQNHILLTDLSLVNPQEIQKTLSHTHHTFKCKITDLSTDVILLKNLFSSIPLTTYRLRLDFNHQFSYQDILSFLKNLEAFTPSIEFLEDPCVFNMHTWNTLSQMTRIPLAADEISLKELTALFPHQAPFSFLVIKPALADWKEKVTEALRLSLSGIVVTSYLDHPVGQLFALSAAQKIHQMTPPHFLKACGLISHSNYKPHLFSQALNIKETRLLPSPGYGIGFDAEFHDLPWKEMDF